jgi:hypothetical protein
MRDYDGRVSPMQVDLMDPDLLDALDTTPQAAYDDEEEELGPGEHGAGGTVHVLEPVRD